MTDRLILVSHHLCPYVQRAAISLAEKNVPFERIDIDLANKPDWFKAISPLGKVPLLRVQHGGKETIIFESAVILEFLEETQANPLHPADPYDRARHRAWIEFGSAILNTIGRLYSASTEAAFLAESGALSAMFYRVEAEFAQTSRTGAWFAGERFSLVDAVFGPIFRYIDAFEHIDDFGTLDGKPHVQAWRKALSERPSVKGAVAADYPERLYAFLRAKPSYLSFLTLRNDPAIRPLSAKVG
ncbi:MAG: glutathione S-transferase family protein [Mesorhizobium sp.]